VSRGKRIIGIVCLFLCGAGWLATVNIRNTFFEFCTTTAYGYPLPVYVEWCLCERSRSPFPVGYIAGDILFVLLLWLGVTTIVFKLRDTLARK